MSLSAGPLPGSNSIPQVFSDIQGIAVNIDSQVFVVERGTQTIHRFDYDKPTDTYGAAGTFSTHIGGINYNPEEIVCHDDFVFVGSADRPDLLVHRISTGSTTVITLPRRPSRIAMDPWPQITPCSGPGTWPACMPKTGVLYIAAPSGNKDIALYGFDPNNPTALVSKAAMAPLATLTIPLNNFPACITSRRGVLFVALDPDHGVYAADLLAKSPEGSWVGVVGHDWYNNRAPLGMAADSQQNLFITVAMGSGKPALVGKFFMPGGVGTQLSDVYQFPGTQRPTFVCLDEQLQRVLVSTRDTSGPDGRVTIFRR